MRKLSEQVDWDDLRFFLAIVRTGQVSSAASRLMVNHTTVARRIDRLETVLNTKLFERGRNGYRPTEAALRLLPSAENMEAAILTGEAEIGGEDAALHGSVRIGSPDGFGSIFLAPRVETLRQRHPALDIEIVATVRPFSLAEREADVAISLEMPSGGRIIGRKLVEFHLGLYASPGYLETMPPATSVGDLAEHRFVGYVEEYIFTRELDLLIGLVDRRQVHFRSSSWLGQLQAAASGAGIAVLPRFLIPSYLGLVQLLPQEVCIRRNFYILIHEDSRNVARIRAAVDFICQEVTKSRSIFTNLPVTDEAAAG
jgi:DNA-binding transcriptional LysR family regulator